jgi:hypothetical protein
MSNETAPNFDLELKEGISPDPSPQKGTLETPEKVLPEKFKGKSVFDLVDMYQNAERKISEQGSQLGELRGLTDQILGLKKDNAETLKDRPKVTAEDLLNDPDVALNQVIDHSKVAERQTVTENRLEALEKSIGQREFEGKHPDFVKDVSDPDFRDWISGNKARIYLLKELNSNYNFEAGQALWDMWEERKELTNKDPNPTKRQVIRQATTVRNSPGGGESKPTYSRAKLLELQTKALQGDASARARWNDPDFQKEYQDAYAEGRVK